MSLRNSISSGKVCCEKVATMEVRYFKKVATLKKQPSKKNKQYGILLFRKISFFKIVALLEKLSRGTWLKKYLF